MRARSSALGYTMVAIAAALFGINGTVSKVILGSGITAERLTELRCTGALFGLALIVAATRPHSLAVHARELPLLALLGIGGLAIVQWSYFYAIHRLAIGVALLIQYVAPLLVALWARFVQRESVRRRIWLALVLALLGLTLIVEVWHSGRLSAGGLLAAGIAALTYAFYLLLAERGARRRDAVSLLGYGFLFASLFWAAVEPWWTFPSARIARNVSLLGHLSGTHLPAWVLVAWMVTFGTIVPFALVVSALPLIGATRTGITAMLEPVIATGVAYAWLGESLGAVQLAGGAAVLAAIGIAQTARG